MKYITFMAPGFIPVSVLFSQHLTHEEMMKKIGLTVIGAGVISFDGDKAQVERCQGTNDVIPDRSLDPELIAHDFRLTRRLSRIANPTNIKTHVPR